MQMQYVLHRGHEENNPESQKQYDINRHYVYYVKEISCLCEFRNKTLFLDVMRGNELFMILEFTLSMFDVFILVNCNRRLLI